MAVLTDSADPKQYIKRMKSRDAMLKLNWGTICTLVPMRSEDVKMHKEMAADQEQLLPTDKENMNDIINVLLLLQHPQELSDI